MDNQHTDRMMCVSPSSWAVSASRAAEAERRQEWMQAMQLWEAAQQFPRHPANQQWAEARFLFCARQLRAGEPWAVADMSRSGSHLMRAGK